MTIEDCIKMYKDSRTVLVATGMLVAVSGTAFVQVPEETQSRASRKMSDKEHMARMGTLSTSDIVAMIDKLSMKDIAASKLHGRDTSSITKQEHTAMMAKMPEQEKPTCSIRYLWRSAWK